MVSIVPADEFFRVEALRICGLDVSPAQCLIAAAGKQRLGFVVYGLDGDMVLLLAIQAEDALLGDALIRAALNVAREQGAKAALCRQPTLFPLLKQQGFVQSGCNNQLEMRAEIRDVLKGHCGGAC